MISKWFELKPNAIKLRKKGLSIRKIEYRLGVPRSTLSGWLRDIKLSQEQKEKLIRDRRRALIKARKKAVLWHNAQKEKRLKLAKKQALETVKSINVADKNVLELALAILYMGEGTKKKLETSIGNSDPLILKFFLVTLKRLYNIDSKKIRCQLNLRADQNPEKMKRFWSKELNIPINNFGYINLDKRTIGSKTYPYYKGVCRISCGNVAIQRKLLHISKMFCERTIQKYLGNWRSG